MSGTSLATRGYIGGSGVSDAVDPVDTEISPDSGEAPGSPGAFSADYSVANVTPIIREITDATAGIGAIYISASYSPALFVGRQEVFRFDSFVSGWTVGSSVTPIANGYRLSILPNGGWPSGVNVSLHIQAVDLAGNVLE